MAGKKKAVKKVGGKRGDITPEMRERAVKMLNDGFAVGEISRKYGVSEASIYAWRKKMKAQVDTILETINKSSQPNDGLDKWIGPATDAEVTKWAERGREEMRIDEAIDVFEGLAPNGRAQELLAELDTPEYRVVVTKGDHVIFESCTLTHPPDITHDLSTGRAWIAWELEK